MAKDKQINTLTEALRESQEIQKDTTIALHAAQALHNTTQLQLSEKKKKHWWQRNKRNNDDIIDAEMKEE